MTTFRYARHTFILQVHGKFNFILGDSGRGKTKLSKFLELNETTHLGKFQGTEIIPYGTFLACLAMQQPLRRKIIYIDEFDIRNSTRKELLALCKNTDCWFILAVRDVYAEVACGIEDIFTMQRNGNTHHMLPKFTVQIPTPLTAIQHVQCEDSCSGYWCVLAKFGSLYQVHPGDGRGDLYKHVAALKGNVLVFCDLCGLTNSATDLFYTISKLPNSYVYTAKSFEHTALSCSMLKGRYKIDDWNEELALTEVSEEVYYEECLNTLYLKSFGIKYDKGSETSVSKMYKDLTWLLPELE